MSKTRALNALGEFVSTEPDELERRRKVYASCANVDTAKFRGYEPVAPPPKPIRMHERRKCDWCGEEYEVTVPNKRFCSADCSSQHRNKVKRDRARAMREARI